MDKELKLEFRKLTKTLTKHFDQKIDSAFSSFEQKFELALQQQTLDIGKIMDNRFAKVDERFDRIEVRLTAVESGLTTVESQMVTRDYLDERLATFAATNNLKVRDDDDKDYSA